MSDPASNIFFACLIAIGIGTALSQAVARKKRLKRFFDRGCLGKEWRARFPAATKQEIREFLELFIRAFGFSRKNRLSFSPDDQVMDIYRALYPPKWTVADALECESLAMECERRYGIDMLDLFETSSAGLTLGDIFTAALKKNPAP